MSGIERNSGMTHSTNSTTLGDLLERILDKGVVIAGDIKIKIVDIELLTIEIRLLICSVDRAEEIGMDWWRNDNKFPGSSAGDSSQSDIALQRVDQRLDRLEALLTSSSSLARGESIER